MVKFYQMQADDSNRIVSIPVGFKEIRTVFGKCFFLLNKQNATTEQKIQGWNIVMNSNQSNFDIVWQVYLGYHGLEYPTYADMGTHVRHVLRPRMRAGNEPLQRF